MTNVNLGTKQTEPDTRCGARMKEARGRMHVKLETKRILASISGVQGKDKNKGP